MLDKYKYLFFVFCFVILSACTYHKYPEWSEGLTKKHNVNAKLGLAIARQYRSAYNEQTELEKHLYLYKILENIVNDANTHAGKERFKLLNTLGENPEYDYSQDYRNFPKRNILEIEYENVKKDQSSLFVLGLFSRAILKYKVSVYDSVGTKTEITDFALEPVELFKGIFFYPFLYFQSAEERELLAEKNLNHLIQSAIEISQSKGIKFEDYDSSFRLTNLPFRMKIDTSDCGSIVQTGVNAPSVRTTWRLLNLHHGCAIRIDFVSFADTVIQLETGNFTLITNKKSYPAKKDIMLNQIDLTGDARITNSFQKSVSMGVNLQPFRNELSRMELFFEYPMEEQPLYVKWQDSTQSSQYVELSIPK